MNNGATQSSTRFGPTHAITLDDGTRILARTVNGQFPPYLRDMLDERRRKLFGTTKPTATPR